MLKILSVKRLLIGGCILLIVVLLLSVFCIFNREDNGVLNVISERVDLQIRDFHYTEVGDPDLIWEINADTAEYIKKENVALFENVQVKLVFSNGGIYTITGQKGSLHTDTKDMDIRGNVVAGSNSGDNFETERLCYTHNNKTISTKDAVKMTRPGTDVSAVGMMLSLKERKATLLSNVRAVITRNESAHN